MFSSSSERDDDAGKIRKTERANEGRVTRVNIDEDRIKSANWSLSVIV